MFGLFRKPSVEAKKPAVRSKAIDTLPGNDPARIQAALHDDDPQVRRTAIDALTDIPALITVANNTAYSAADLHEAAFARLAMLTPAAKDASQLRELQLNEAQAVNLVKTSPSPAIRLHAAAKVHDQALLARLALEDKASAVRQMAFQQVSAHDYPELAKQIIDRYQGKDKTLTKLATAHYERQQADQAEQQRLTDTITMMQQLAEADTTDLSTFAKLEQQWRTHYNQASTAQQQAWEQAHRHAQQRLKVQSDQRAARQAVLNQANALAQQVHQQPYLSPEAGDQLVEDIARLQANWQAVGNGQDPDSLRIERECNQIFQQLQSAYHQLSEHYHHSHRQRRMIDELEQTLQQPGRVDEKTIRQIESTWQKMPKVKDGRLQVELDRFFARKLDRLKSRQTAGEAAAANELSQLNALQRQLDQAVEQQLLQEALSARREISELLTNCIGLTDKQRQQAQRHVNSHRAAIQQLQGWAKWGGSQAREQLITDLAAAATQAHPPHEIVQLLRTARQQWRQINREAGYPDKALKQAFEQACDALHEPVKIANQEKADAQAQALAERETVVTELERLEQETDWPHYKDWTALNESLKTAQQRWSKCGGVNQKDWKTINHRYHQARKALQAQLEKPLAREIARRERLISQAESLAASEDKVAAMQTVKELRASWKPTLTASRKQENALWERFNQACNAVFEQSQAERQAQRAEDDAALNDRRRLLAELRSHLRHEHWSARLAARRTVDSLQQSWLHQQPIETPAATKLEKQWQQAMDQFQRAATHAERVKQLVMIDGLFQTAATLQRAEAALVSHETDLLETLRESLMKLAHDYPDHQNALNARRTQWEQGKLADTVSTDQWAAWCLEAEIIAQVPSPASELDARRAKQVAIMAEQMTQVITDTQRLASLTDHLRAFVSPSAASAHDYYARYRVALLASINALLPEGEKLIAPLDETEASEPTSDPDTAQPSQSTNGSKAGVPHSDASADQQSTSIEDDAKDGHKGGDSGEDNVDNDRESPDHQFDNQDDQSTTREEAH